MSADSIQEAMRYMDNAKEILRDKAVKEDGYYQDSKYVKIAGHTAYSGILLALDAFLGKKTKGRKDVDWYKSHLSKMDKKVLNAFLTAYQVLHLDMAYVGAKSAELAATGFKEAENVINWLAIRSSAA